MYASVALLSPPYACLTYALPPEFPAAFWQAGLRLAVGITFMVIFGLGTLGCLIGLGIISPADVVVSATEGGGILMTGIAHVMSEKIAIPT